MDLGRKLKEARKKKKLTQLDVANKLELDFTSISKHENNKADPPYKVLMKYSELYDIPIEELFTPTQEELQLAEDIKTLDLKELLEKGKGITFEGEELNDEDRQDFLAMLKVAFEMKQRNKRS